MSPRKILLLSDDSPIFPVLDKVFTAEGYQVTTTRSSHGALEALRTDDFRLLIARITPNGLRVFPVLRTLRKKAPGAWPFS
jgi:DNA-binding response OmpR family regulator